MTEQVRSDLGQAASAPKPSAHPPRWIISIGSVLLLIGATCALFAWTAWGRGQLAGVVSRQVSAAIAGRIEIDALSEISGTEVTVQGLTFFAPSGEPVLALERARIDLNPMRLWAGELALASADTFGGRLTIAEVPSGDVTIAQAFASPHSASSTGERRESESSPSAKQQSAGATEARADARASEGAAPRITLRNLRVHRLEVVIQLQDMEPFRIAVQRALVRVEVSEAGDAEVAFQHVTGELTHSPLGRERARLRGLRGRYRGAVKRLLSLDGPLNMEGDDIYLTLDYLDRQQDPVVVRVSQVDPEQVELQVFGALGDLANADVRVETEPDDP